MRRHYHNISICASGCEASEDTPFELSADPFFSEANIRRLERAANDVRSGKAVLTEHELIDD